MKNLGLKTKKFHKSFTRIPTFHWDLAKDYLHGLHVKMVGIQRGVLKIVWGSRGQWW